MRGIILTIIGALVILAIFFGRYAGIPIDEASKAVLGDARNFSLRNAASAPVRCGPYFIYIHPESQTDRFKFRRKVFVVSNNPPDDETIDTIYELWSYGVRMDVISRKRPVVSRNERFSRNSIRPAMYSEMIGDYIGDDPCYPYRSTELSCDGRSPFCNPIE